MRRLSDPILIVSRHKANKHIHRLIKIDPVWKCAIIGCTYFVHQKQAYALPGVALCWKCDKPFPFDERARNETAAMCLECSGETIELPDDLFDAKEATK